MNKIFRVSEAAPRSLAPYERIRLDEIAINTEEVEAVVDQDAIREAVLAEAREEAERKVQEAYAEGLRRGAEAGRAQFLQEVGQAAATLEAAAEAIRQARQEYLDSLEPQVVELGVEIARQILLRESRTDPELVVRTVRRALEHLVERGNLAIHINPQDADTLRAQKISLLEEFDGVRQITVLPDPEIAPGGCVVETEHVHVDARIEAQLERVLDALREEPEAPLPDDSLDEA